MPEHVRYARNRREFLTECFCGAGSLAFAFMMAFSETIISARYTRGAAAVEQVSVGYYEMAMAEMLAETLQKRGIPSRVQMLGSDGQSGEKIEAAADIVRREWSESASTHGSHYWHCC